MSGDVTIGPIRLIRGDCLQVMPCLGRVDHIVCDPPYEQTMHDAKSGNRPMRLDGGTELRALDFSGIDTIRADFAHAAAAICDGWLLAFCTIEGAARWADVINPMDGIRYKRACAWIKPDCAPQFNGQGPGSWGELFIAAWCGGGFSRCQGGGKRGIYAHLTNPPDRNGAHPTEKPWRLMRDILFDFSAPGDVVLDPFMGSGTTLVAAALTGRRAIGIEIDPTYFDVAVARVRKAVSTAAALGVQAQPQVQEVLL